MAGKNPLSSLLGRSPIGPIQEHMQVVNASAQLLRDLFTAASAENWQSVKEIDREIIAAKANADKLRQSIRKPAVCARVQTDAAPLPPHQRPSLHQTPRRHPFHHRPPLCHNPPSK